MALRQIQSLQEAEARLVRAMLVLFCAMVLTTFAYSLYEFWQDSVVKAFGMALLLTAIVAVLVGGTFLATLPGAKRHLKASWAARESKEAPNQQVERTR